MDTFTRLISEMKTLLNQPLPGGRGFQVQRDRDIIALAQKIAVMQPRSF